MPIPSGAPRPRNPGEIASGLLAWWRGDQGVCTDTGGTTPATNGQSAAYWRDLSGNGRHATQATAGLRPVYTTNALGGMPGVRVNPGCYLAVGPVAAAAGVNLTLFSVASLPTDTSGTNSIATINTADLPNNRSIVLCSWSPNSGGLASAGGRNLAGGFVACDNPSGPGGDCFVVRLTTAGAMTSWVGATRRNSVTGCDHTNSANENICACGRSDTSLPANSLVTLETAAWSRYITDDEASALIAYAKARYGL